MKNNILFGLDFDEEWYVKVLLACDLLSDLKLLSHGDETIIGDRGINLSGGQRARIGLARAVYANADVYLMDDPLSAVDPKVGNTLFQKTICTALAGKTRVLVTHQVQFLSSPSVTRVVVLSMGKLAGVGSFSALKEEGSLDWLGNNDGDAHTQKEAPTEMINRVENIDEVDQDQVPDLPSSALRLGTSQILGHSVRYLSVGCSDDGPAVRAANRTRSRSRTTSMQSNDSEPGTPKVEDADMIVLGSGMEGLHSAYVALDDIDTIDQDHVKHVESQSSYTGPDIEGDGSALYTRLGAEEEGGIIAAEDKNMGNVNSEAYAKYFEAMGGFVIIFIGMVLMVLGQASAMYCTVWLAYWARKSEDGQEESYNRDVYIGLVVACCVFSLSRSAVAFITTTKAASRLHDAMLASVLRATVLFFDRWVRSDPLKFIPYSLLQLTCTLLLSNPIGRILNRFSKDQFFVDDLLPPTFYDFIQCGLMVGGAVVLVCIGSPMIVIILIPLVPFFLYLRRAFLQTSREVKRLDALCRSPVFSHISESLDGLTTIRAFGKLLQFKSQHKALVDAHTRPDFAFMAASRWLGFRLDGTVVALMTASTFGAVAAAKYKLGGSPEALSAGVM